MGAPAVRFGNRRLGVSVSWSSRVGGESKGEINRLRSRAGRMGISIRTRRPDARAKRPAYSLVDRKTGTVIDEDIDGLVDLETRLARIASDRQFQARALPTTRTLSESCPTCGIRRIGRFRWCTSCGFDFESTVHSGPPRPVFRLQVDDPAVPMAAWDLIQPPAYLRDLPRRRFRVGRFAFRDRYPSVSLRAIWLWLILAVLIGLIVSIAIGATR